MAEKRIDELIKIINKANYEYYTLDKPTLTDQEYDIYMQELQTLEEKYPKLKIVGSSLQTNKLIQEADYKDPIILLAGNEEN